MQRITISLSDALANDFDAWMQRRQYGNRSEAVRDLVRAALEAGARGKSVDHAGYLG